MTISRVNFRNDRGQRLVGSLHHPAGEAIGGAAICHGMLSDRGSPKHQAIAEALAARGLLTLRFDFTGRGESEGAIEEISYDGQLGDLTSAVAFLRRRIQPISLVGSSMGGAVALLYAAGDPAVARLAVVATVGRPAEVLEGLGGDEVDRQLREQGTFELAGHRLGPGLVESSRRVDVVGAARAFDRPLLLIHGELDDVVPLAQAEELARVAPRAELVVIPGGDHMLRDDGLQRWLAQRIAEFMTGGSVQGVAGDDVYGAGDILAKQGT